MSKLAHLTEILITLQYKKIVTAQELSEVLDVDKKTIYRYIDSLVEASIPVQTKKGRNGGFYIEGSYYMKSANLTYEELQTLLLASELLTEHRGFAYEHQLKTAVTKIKNNSNIDVDNKLGIRLNGYPGDLDDALSKLISSIQSGRAVELTYISIGSDNIVKIVVDPYNVIYKEGEWHLIGLEHRLNQVRNYQLKRVEKIKTTNLISIKPINFSLSKYINNSWGAFIGDKIKVVIRFDQKSKNIITNHKWHYNQVLEVIEEGDILLKLYLDNISEIKNWVMGFGSAAEVVEPLQLREEIKVEVDKLKNIYSA